MPRQLALIVLMLAVAIPAAALKPIDDFEAGPFFFQTTGAYQEHFVPVFQHAGHVYTSTRKVVLEPASGSATISAQLSLTGGDDAANVTFTGGGRVRFAYHWEVPYDITEDGAYDRIEVAYNAVTPGAYFSFGIGNVGTFCGVERFPDAGPGVVSWPIDFCNQIIDPTQAIAMVLYLNAGGGDASFEVTDVRFMRSGAIIADITRDFLATQVPPIPSSPLSWRAFDHVLQPLFGTALVFESVSDGGTIPALTADLQQESFHGGDIVRSTVTWQEPGEPSFVEFLISFELTPADGLTPQIDYPPDPFIGATDFSVLLGVMLYDENGISHGTSMIRLVVTCNPAHEYEFVDVQAVVTDSGARSNDRLEVSFILESEGDFDPEEPFFDMVWMADWEDQTLTGVGDPVVIGGGPRTLVAAPSLTSSSTTLRASRPFAAGETIAIYDISGRLVRKLAPPVGAGAMVWDGRDRSGNPAASGTYLARWQGRSGAAAVARVVRVR